MVSSLVHIRLSHIFLLTFALSGLILFPQPGFALSGSDAQLLLEKTGFQPSSTELNAIKTYATREAATTALLNSITTQLTVPPPSWTSQPRLLEGPNPTPDQHIAFEKKLESEFADLKNWSVAEMVATPSPLQERLMLFWHNHFTTAFYKVRVPLFLWNQDKMLRANASGSFAIMLQAIVHDPAMLDYLDQETSTCQGPKSTTCLKPNSTNEAPTANLARELMELFTLGLTNQAGAPNYSETDVAEVARALTGLTYDQLGNSVFDPNTHDTGSKTILGQKGNWGPDDVVRILLAQSDCAQFIVTELWKEFVSANPNQATINVLSTNFAKSGYQLKPLLYAMFTSADFWNPTNVGSLVKSPAEFVVGSVRQLGLPATTDNVKGYASFIEHEGLLMFNPPNVRGFLTGSAWMNTLTLAYRQEHAHAFGQLYQTEIYKTSPADNGIRSILPQDYNAFFASQVTLDQPMLAAPTDPLTPYDAEKLVMSDPVYSLK